MYYFYNKISEINVKYLFLIVYYFYRDPLNCKYLYYIFVKKKTIKINKYSNKM